MRGLVPRGRQELRLHLNLARRRHGPPRLRDVAAVGSHAALHAPDGVLEGVGIHETPQLQLVLGLAGTSESLAIQLIYIFIL